jgi:hypothetical protein
MPDRGPGKPSATEDEYFVREDAEKKRKLALQEKKDREAGELKRLRDLHYMHCPKCGLTLHELKFRGVHVDVCFHCNGVFLDQRDIEKMEKPESRGLMSSILNWFKPETKKPV